MPKQFLTGLSIGLLAGCVLMFLFARNLAPEVITKSSFEIQLPGESSGSVKFNVEGEGIDYTRLLAAMFSNEFLKGGAISWLAEHQNLYPIASPDVATAISTELCEPIPKEPLDARISKGRECAEKPTAAALRRMASAHLPPFHYVGIRGILGVPGNPADRPRLGHASVCRDGDLFGKQIQIANPQNGAHITVDATGSYVCTPAFSFPDVQLGTEDAFALLGDRPIMQKEEIIIVPLN